ncbi:MAG: hypothetical protein HYX29_03670 [Solirubrobacterales bacterium]|nr:hypothetical protein [Solirubrobacterales bacterium]
MTQTEQSVPRAFVWTSLVVLASTGASVVQFVVIAAFVGFNRSSDAFFAGLIIFQLLLIIAISTRTPIVARLTADVSDEEFPALARVVMNQSVRVALLALLGCGLLISALGALMLLFGTRGSFSGAYLTNVALFALAGAMYILGSAISGMAFVRNQFKATSLAFVASSLTTVIATLILTPLIGAYGATLAAVCSGLMLLFLHMRIYGSIVLSKPVTVPARPSLRFGAATLSSAAIAIGWQANIFLVTIFLGRDFPAGVVSVFSLLASVVGVILGVTAGALYNAMLPRITAGVARTDPEEARSTSLILLDAMRFPAIILVPVATWLAFVAWAPAPDGFWDRLDVFFQPDYKQTLVLLLIGALAQVVTTVLVAVGIAKNLYKALYATAFACVITLVTAMVIFEPGSVQGVAAAVVASYFVSSAVMLIWCTGSEAGFIALRILLRIAALGVLAAVCALPALLVGSAAGGGSQLLLALFVVIAPVAFALIAGNAFDDYRQLRRFLTALVADRLGRQSPT